MTTACSNPAFDYVKSWNDRLTEGGWWHSFELPDGSQIRGVCTLEGLQERIRRFPIPDDLRGKRVLDIGAWDGFFSFEMERRGADVMAIDCWDNPRFREMQAIYSSRVDYRQLDMFELTPERIGRFDIVLFMGVLYHLKHPLLALERVCALTEDYAAVDSFILQDQHAPELDVKSRPLMEFYETTEFGGQFDNWFAPNLPCLLGLCRTAGFARVQLEGVQEFGASVSCYRHWDPPSGSGLAPELVDVEHPWNHGINFSSTRDEYVMAWFRCREQVLTADDLRPRIGPYGVRAAIVTRFEGDLWQANCKIPPLAKGGWQDVSLCVRGSLPSNLKRIAVDIPLEASPIQVSGVCDGTTWEDGAFEPAKGSVISIWVEGLPANADRNNVRVRLQNAQLPVKYIADAQAGSKFRQLNLDATSQFTKGDAELTVECAGARTPPRQVGIR